MLWERDGRVRIMVHSLALVLGKALISFVFGHKKNGISRRSWEFLYIGFNH